MRGERGRIGSPVRAQIVWLPRRPTAGPGAMMQIAITVAPTWKDAVFVAVLAAVEKAAEKIAAQTQSTPNFDMIAPALNGMDVTIQTLEDN